MILERDGELAALRAAGAAAQRGGAHWCWCGTRRYREASLLRTRTRTRRRLACAYWPRGAWRWSGSFLGIVRQLFEPVRAAAGPGKWRGCWTGRPGWPPASSTGARPAGRRRRPACDDARALLAGREPGGARAADDHGGRCALGRRAVPCGGWRTWPPALKSCRLCCCSRCGTVLLASRSCLTNCAPARPVRRSGWGRSASLGPPPCCVSSSAARPIRLCQGLHAAPAGIRSCSTSLAVALRDGRSRRAVERLGPQPVAEAVLRRVRSPARAPGA